MRRVRPTSAEAARHRSRPLAGLARPTSAGSIASSAAAAVVAHSSDPGKTAKPAAYLAAAVEYRRRQKRDGGRPALPIAPKTAPVSRAPGSVAYTPALYETIPTAVTPALLKAAADAPECKSCAVTNKKSIEWIAEQQRRAFAEMDAEFAAERAKANPLVPAGDGGGVVVVVATKVAASGVAAKKPRASTASGDAGGELVPLASSDTGDADRDTEFAEKPAVSDARRPVKRKEDSATNGAETTATATTATTKELRLGDASRVASTLMRDLVAELGVAKGKTEWLRRLGAWSRVDRATPSAPTISVDGSPPRPPPPPPSVAVARLHAALLRAECALAFTSPTVRAYDGERDSEREQHNDDANGAAAAAAATYGDVCRARYLCGQLTPHLASISASSRRSVARRSAELALAVGKLDPAGLQRATSRHVDATQLAARLASAREFVRDAVARAASEHDARSPSFYERVARRLAMLVYLHHAVASVARSAAAAAVHDHWRKRLAALVNVERGADGGALEWHSAARPIIDSYAAAPVSTF